MIERENEGKRIDTKGVFNQERALSLLRLELKSYRDDGSLEDTRVGDDGRLGGLSGAGADLLESLHNILSFEDLTENGVSAIEPGGGREGDEELGAVGVGASVGHGEKEGLGVLQGEVLVSELVAVDGLATGAVAVREVATLGHEAGDDSVEAR